MLNYLPILLQVVIAIGFAVVAILVSLMLGKAGKRNPTKDSAYECGMLPIGDSQPRFSVKFYLVAMLFILFDIEIVFMYPWAVVYREFIAQHGLSIFWSMLSFVGILTAGYVYAIMKGALDWKAIPVRQPKLRQD
jgi:NADH-quinone oxidoreductase subunit A